MKVFKALAFLSCLASFFFQYGCKNNHSSKSRVNDIENANEAKAKVIGDIKVKVTYRPSELVVRQELANRKSKSDSLVKVLGEQYGRYLYFIVSMSRKDNEILSTASSEDERQQEMKDLMFNMRDYVAATSDTGDTLVLADYIYPRVYGASRSTDLMFAFDRPAKNKGEITITVGDIGIGSGTNKFTFKLEDLN